MELTFITIQHFQFKKLQYITHVISKLSKITFLMRALIFALKVILLSGVFLFCFYLPLLSQQSAPDIDSLLIAAQKKRDLPTKINLYFLLATHYKYTNADSALIFNRLALKYAILTADDSSIAQGYYNIAAIEAARNNYEIALKNCDSAFKYFQLSKNTHALAMVRNVQGGVYMTWGKNELASQMYFDAIKYTQDDTASARILYTYHNLVILLNAMQKNSLALEYAMKQYKWAKRIKINDEIAYACANIIDTYTELDSFSHSKPYILELSRMTGSTEDPNLKVMVKNYLGILYHHENLFSKAVDNFIESLRLNDNLIDKQLGCNTLINLGKTYQKLNLLKKSDSCFYRAIEISTSIDVKEERKNAYEQLVQNALLKNDYKKAFYFNKLFHRLSDSLMNEKSQQAFVDAESKYKFEENKKQIELLNAKGKFQEAETEKQRLTKNIIIVSTILLFIIIALFFNRYQLKKKVESQRALLNERKRISRDLHDDVGSTLSSVKAYSEILKDNPDNPVITALLKENATEMMERLEIIAWATNPQHDTFGNLIDKLNRYAIPICKAKNIHYDVFSEGVAKELMMPGEIRQNLYLVAKEAINNTIKYSGACKCTIKTEISNGKFLMEIKDDGKGFDNEVEGIGNGLKNMYSRIKEIGGELLIASAPAKGTQIKVLLNYPFKISNSLYIKKS